MTPYVEAIRPETTLERPQRNAEETHPQATGDGQGSKRTQMPVGIVSARDIVRDIRG